VLSTVDGGPWQEVKKLSSLATLSAIKHHGASILHKLAMKDVKKPPPQSTMAYI